MSINRSFDAVKCPKCGIYMSLDEYDNYYCDHCDDKSNYEEDEWCAT